MFGNLGSPLLVPRITPLSSVAGNVFAFDDNKGLEPSTVWFTPKFAFNGQVTFLGNSTTCAFFSVHLVEHSDGHRTKPLSIFSHLDSVASVRLLR